MRGRGARWGTCPAERSLPLAGHRTLTRPGAWGTLGNVVSAPPPMKIHQSLLASLLPASALLLAVAAVPRAQEVAAPSPSAAAISTSTPTSTATPTATPTPTAT